nr:unnamed protein product [Callosobruchus analis]
MVSPSITNEDIFRLIKDSNKEIKANIEQINRNINELKTELGNVNAKYNKIEEENKILKNRIQTLENKYKKYNIVIYGVSETEENPIAEALEFVNKELKVAVDQNSIRDAFRIGRKQEEGSSKERPLLVECLHHSTKLDILVNAKKLPRGCGYFVADDYTAEEYQKRKVLYSHLKKARETHNSAYIKKNILYVNGSQYTYEDLVNDVPEEDVTTTPSSQQTATEKASTQHIDPKQKNTHVNTRTEEKAKVAVQKGASFTNPLLRNTPPRLRSNFNRT